MAFLQTKANINGYVIQKKWYWYVPLWILGAYLFYTILQVQWQQATPAILFAPYAINFAVHEWAHIFTFFLPMVMVAAAGSAAEILLGLAIIFIAFKYKMYFASMFGFLWVMFSARKTGFYMQDSRAQQGEYVSLGGALSGSTDTTHDWEFIFNTFGVLQYDMVIGIITHAAGIAMGLLGLGFAAWLMYKMAKSAKAKQLTKKEEDLLLVSTLQARQVKK